MDKKRANRTTKSEAIRQILAKNPNANAKDVAKQVGVSPNLVYYLKARMKRKARKARRATAVAAGKAAGLSDPVQLIRRIRDLAAEAGGMAKLKELVEVLAE